MSGGDAPPRKALQGLRVLDLATLIAGPLAATVMADFGADVIKIEHPRGDPIRSHGYSKDDVSLWWKFIGRNKRAVTLNLSTPRGRDIFLELVRHADVAIENFRPGTLERWGLGPDVLHEANPRLVVARVTGFGQTGPLRSRPGFGTLAEAMSGFAAMTGEPEGPPTLPPFGLADGIAALATTAAVMFALHARATTGRGQVIDLALIEPILTILGPQPTWFDQLGVVQRRTGNRSVNNAPRNTYRTSDGRWLAVSSSAQSVAERIVRLVGRPELAEEPWFASGTSRAEHADELDEAVAGWIGARTADEVVAAFEEAGAAVAPIYDVRDVLRDPQFEALRSIVSVADPELGSVRMQNVMFRLGEGGGSVEWAGRPLGHDNAGVYGDLVGLGPRELDDLREAGVV
jgi:crotonobetainyl-CoA:carnitine CoA-transferase CaiB-like acyl-CoA transferase